MSEKLEQTILAFVETPKWADDADPPEDNAAWRAGYEAAQGNLREALKPWWPFGGPLCLTPSPSPALDDVAEAVTRYRKAVLDERNARNAIEYGSGGMVDLDAAQAELGAAEVALDAILSRTVSESAPNKAVGAETPPVRSAGEVGRLVDLLWAATAHGDEDHRAWLREACTAFFAGQPVPEPRGKGNKEALLQRYAAALEEIAGFVPDRSSNVSTQQLIEAIKFIARTALEGVSEPSPPTVT